MKNIFIVSLTLALSLTLNASQDDAQYAKTEKLAEEKCGACHLIGKITKEKLRRMAAPPSWALAKKVKISYPNRLDGIAFITDFTMNPTEKKMLFPKETKERFGLMPSQKGAVTKEELLEIAKYILD